MDFRKSLWSFRRPGTTIQRNIPELPVETLVNIFSYCETSDLISRALVCRKWAHVALAVAWKDLDLAYIVGERQTASMRPLFNILQSTECSRRGTASFEYHSYIRNVSIILRLVGGDKDEHVCAHNRVTYTRSILSNIKQIADLKVVLDVDTLFQERGAEFIRHLLELPTPTHSTHLVISGVPCDDKLVNDIAQKYGPTLHSFHFVNGEPVSLNSAMNLSCLSPNLESLALIVPYEGLLLKTITGKNPKVKTLGLHFRNPGGTSTPSFTPPAVVAVPPLPTFNQLAGAVGFVEVAELDDAGAMVLDDDDNEGSEEEVPAEVPQFLTSLEGLFASGMRLTCIKISGQSAIPEGEGSRILEIIGREAIGLKRLQFTAVRDPNLGSEVQNLSALSSLEHLIVSLTSIHPSFLLRVAHSCPLLTEVRAEGTQITDECVKAFASNCKNLRILQLALCVRLTIHAVVAVIQYGSGRLRSLDLSYCWPVLRCRDPLLILIWLVEGNPDLEKLGVMFKPFHDFTSVTLQKLAG
ncbi:hypothetical protein HK097_009879, partial [Rhizophlyctis rosea]